MILDDDGKETGLVKNIINTMLLLTKQLRMYGAENQLITLTTSRLKSFFEDYFRHHEALALTVARHGFIYDDDFVERTSKAFEAFAYMLFQHGVSAINCSRDLTTRDIHTFLIMVGRPPAESWEEGGIVASLGMRDVVNITVREMAESDIAFNNDFDPTTAAQSAQGPSPLWDRFAFAVFHGLSVKNEVENEEPEVIAPDALATMTNRLLASMSLASQQSFSKGLSNFLISVQQEKILPYRNRALAKLTEFINRVSPEIRARLFKNILNLNMKPEFTREFCAGLSDQVIVEVLEQSARQISYTPPVILKLLGKIARERDLNVQNIDKLDLQINERKADIAKLFQKDAFEKFVPDSYQKVLLGIIQQNRLPDHLNENLQLLKKSLQESQQESHVADVVLRILNDSVEPEQLDGIDENLVNSLYLFLEQGNYPRINYLRKLALENRRKDEDFKRLHQACTSAAFTRKVIDDIALYGKAKLEAIETLVTDIGPAFIAPLLERLAVEPNRSHRLSYLQLLKKLDSRLIIKEARNHLHDSRWFFVRNVVLVLGSIQNAEARPCLLPLISHPHPKVKIEAMRACLQYNSREAILALIQMLDDDDAKEVETGISLALLVKTPEVIERLILLLQRSTLFDYQFARKKMIVQTLAEIAPEEALPVFTDIIRSRSLTHANQLEKLKLVIIETLQRRESGPLLPVLKKLVTETSGTVHSRLQFLLRREEEER